MPHAVRLTPDALRQVRSGHPWVYDRSIRSGPQDAAPGDLAVVFDDKRRFAAIGLWDPQSPIRLRVLHVGPPTQIGSEWVRLRLAEAAAKRSQLREDPGVTGWRAVHGENDGLPGLVVDVYEQTVVIKLDTAAWLVWMDAVVDAVDAELSPRNIVLRASRSVPGVIDGSVLRGSVEQGRTTFLENGLTFTADVIEGNKTGYFLDQRDNRQLVREASAGRTVLDVFSSSGGFSVHAAAGGATDITSVDISSGALEACRRHMEFNSPAVTHRPIVGDAFDELSRLARADAQFHLVVVDPPSFASKAADVKRALRGYARLTKLALEVLQPGGMLVQASCSSRVSQEEFFKAVNAAAQAAERPLTEIRRTGHASDHPVGFAQGAYLKAVFAIA